MALSKKQRDALPESDFAVPGKRALPMHDETHTRLAWDMVERTGGLSDSEKSEARSRIKRRAKDLGIDTSDWEKSVSSSLELQGMAVLLPPVADHPNRMPFSGVLMRVDQPSDEAPGGAGGKRVIISRKAAEDALDTLAAMGVDFKPQLDGHDPTRKIGIITDAEIKGDAIAIEGFFYKADFPTECARIRAEKEELGFSMEMQAHTRDAGGGLLEIVSGTFTGAAVLYKDKAAYHTTSLAAQHATEKEMTNEEFQALLAPLSSAVENLGKEVAEIKSGASRVEANKDLRDKVSGHASKLRDCAASMEAAGIGLHSTQGHVRLLHHMAASMEADAAAGRVPYIFRDHDWTFHGSADPAQVEPEEDPALKSLIEAVGSLTTMVKDLQAKAFQAAQAPERKTVSSQSLHLLAKGGVNEAPEKPMTSADADRILDAAGVKDASKRMAAKIQFTNEGLMAQ